MFEVQTYCHTDNTVHYEMIEDAIDYDNARDIISKKYPNRNVIAVIKKPLVQLAQDPTKTPCGCTVILSYTSVTNDES